MKIVTAIEVKQHMNDFFIIDIREPYEYEFANIACINIPMAEVCDRIVEFPADKNIVLMCKSGNRASALANLLTIDFQMNNIYIMEGGISSWKEQVDNTLILE